MIPRCGSHILTSRWLVSPHNWAIADMVKGYLSGTQLAKLWGWGGKKEVCLINRSHVAIPRFFDNSRAQTQKKNSDQNSSNQKSMKRSRSLDDEDVQQGNHGYNPHVNKKTTKSKIENTWGPPPRSTLLAMMRHAPAVNILLLLLLLQFYPLARQNPSNAPDQTLAMQLRRGRSLLNTMMFISQLPIDI